MRESLSPVTALAVAICSVVVAGCSILAPVPDQSRFFVLTRMPSTDAPPASVWSDDSTRAPGMSLGVGPISIPGYLDRSEIATRVSPTQVEYSSENRWAESLTISISRVLSENLATLVGTDRIVQYPWFGSIPLRYYVQIDILRLDNGPAGDGHLHARWAIRDGHTRTFLVVRESELTRPATSTDPAAAVAALSAVLGDFSQEIARALRQLPKPQPAGAAS